MIKKFLGTILVLLLAGGVLALSVERATLPTKAASVLKFRVEEGTNSGQVKERVDYYLPYPGILPDHPFYKLKMVRDRIWLWMTKRGVKRVELLLLLANKRVGAGEALVRGNKVELGISTLTKGVKYFERALNEARGLPEAEKGRLREEFGKALAKYREAVEDLLIGLEGSARTSGEEVLKFVENLQKNLESF